MNPIDPDREFLTVLTAAVQATVEVHWIDCEPESFNIASHIAKHIEPDLERLVHWSPSPTELGAATHREVAWIAGSASGDTDVGIPAWLGFLHEVAHAATGYGPGAGSEIDAAVWEWDFAAAVFGPTSRNARAVRRWASEAGCSAFGIRQHREPCALRKLLGMKEAIRPSRATLEAAKQAFNASASR